MLSSSSYHRHRCFLSLHTRLLKGRTFVACGLQHHQMRFCTASSPTPAQSPGDGRSWGEKMILDCDVKDSRFLDTFFRNTETVVPILENAESSMLIAKAAWSIFFYDHYTPFAKREFHNQQTVSALFYSLPRVSCSETFQKVVTAIWSICKVNTGFVADNPSRAEFLESLMNAAIEHATTDPSIRVVGSLLHCLFQENREGATHPDQEPQDEKNPKNSFVSCALVNLPTETTYTCFKELISRSMNHSSLREVCHALRLLFHHDEENAVKTFATSSEFQDCLTKSWSTYVSMPTWMLSIILPLARSGGGGGGGEKEISKKSFEVGSSSSSSESPQEVVHHHYQQDVLDKALTKLLETFPKSKEELSEKLQKLNDGTTTKNDDDFTKLLKHLCRDGEVSSLKNENPKSSDEK